MRCRAISLQCPIFIHLTYNYFIPNLRTKFDFLVDFNLNLNLLLILNLILIFKIQRMLRPYNNQRIAFHPTIFKRKVKFEDFPMKHCHGLFHPPPQTETKPLLLVGQRSQPMQLQKAPYLTTRPLWHILAPSDWRRALESYKK